MTAIDTGDHILLRALRCRPTERTPAWIMRQAGRYLPEYRALRRRAGDFLNLCKTPVLAVEATLQPLRRFPLDAAIIFSDILTIPDAMGLGLRIEEGEGPRFAKPLRRAADIRALRATDPERDLRYVLDAVQLARRELNGRVPLIGFAGSPWTLAVYMVEGAGGGEFARSLKFAREQPQSMRRLLRLLSESVAEYLNAQIAHGAEVVMIFDSWGGLLGGDHEKFSLDHIAAVINRLDRTVPVIVFAKGAAAHLESIAACGCDAIGVDATVNLAEARRRVGDRVALQGNLAPEILLQGNAAEVESAVRAILASHPAPGHIFNLAHGILPATDPGMVQKMLDTVHRLSTAPIA